MLRRDLAPAFPLHEWPSAASHLRKEYRNDSYTCEVMQAEREGEPLVPPAVFHWASQGRVSLPWEAKALDGLELPSEGVGRVIGNGFGVRDVK